MLAGSSLFVGIILFAIAGGAVFPNMFKLTAPLICRGTVSVESVEYSYKPGQIGWQRYVYCVDATGQKNEITYPSIFVTGLIASVVIFAVQFYRTRSTIFVNKTSLERLNDLADMQRKGQISEEEYQQRKSDIIAKL
jgi:hypothetical protein